MAFDTDDIDTSSVWAELSAIEDGIMDHFHDQTRGLSPSDYELVLNNIQERLENMAENSFNDEGL